MSGFGWDYPPGVSGLEPQIAGWPECPKCGEELNGTECEDCGYVAEEYEPDPDAGRDEPPAGWGEERALPETGP